MLVTEREPVIYTSTSNDWSAASIMLAGAVLALLGFLIYYFSIMHAVTAARLPASSPHIIMQHEVPPLPMHKPVTADQPAFKQRASGGRLLNPARTDPTYMDVFQ